MSKLTAVAAALLLSATLACGKKKSSDGDQAPPAKPAAPAPAPTPAPAPAPAAPTYSAEAAKAAVAELSKCTSEYNCAAFDTLIGFGAPAAADLLALAIDTTASADARKIAAAGLIKLKAPDVGAKLIEAAGAVKDDSILQGDLYEAAGASGGQATFDALIAEYAKAIASLDDDRDIPLRGGLKTFPAASVAWVKANLPTAKEHASSYADLITDSATAADLPTVVELLGATKDLMARHRLAAKAIELGDVAHFDVFVAGLSSKDEYDRSDAANFLADVADKAPAELKAQLVELLQKGKAGDQGGLTAMGYDQALKKLGAP